MTGGRGRTLFKRALAAVRDDQAALAFLLAIFLGRFFLSDWNSYWNDEVLSVWAYGTSHANLWRAIVALAEGSIHPPLYQSVLYVWMQIFGDGETATRSLSNLYVTLAGLFLYLTIKRPWGRAVALASTVGFELMSIPTAYALESRSYAQTILLVTASSWLALWLLSHEAEATLPRRTRAGNVAALIAVNSALMLTHYYNVFWLLAQLIFLAVYLALTRPMARWRSALARLLLVGGIPQLVFGAVWGVVFARQYLAREEEYGIEGSARSPLDLLMSSAVGENLVAPAAVLTVVGLAVLATLAWYIAVIARSRGSATSTRGWTYVYLVAWLILPLVVVYAAFSVVGVERYSDRYFVFAVPPLAPLIVIAAALGLQAVWRRVRGSLDPFAHAATITAAGLLVVALVLPGGYAAATDRKNDWRGIAQDVVDIVERDPEHDYVLAEMSFSSTSRLDYYYQRLSDDIRSDARAVNESERNGDYGDFLESLPEPGSGQRVIMVFNHHDSRQYPKLLSRLDGRYERLLTQIDQGGRGFIVYSAEAYSAEPAPSATG